MDQGEAPAPGDRPPSEGLWSRKRLAAMQRVQRVALDLIEERGYASVTVEEVALAAEVAPRSVYRYFGTKEGMVLWNETDLALIEGLAAVLPEVGLMAALRTLADAVDGAMEGEALELGVRQLRLAHRTPELRAQLAVAVTEYAAELGRALAASQGKPPDDEASQVVAAAVMAGLTTALETWYLRGAREPMGAHIHAALDALGALGAEAGGRGPAGD